MTRGPSGRTGKTGLTRGPSGRTGKTGLTRGPGGRTGKTGLTRGPGGRTGKAGLTRGPGGWTGRTGVGRDRRDTGRIVRDGRNRGPRIDRERRRIFVNNRWRTLIPLVALGTVVVGAETLYADGYVAEPAPACVGVTEDGCRLRWQAVPTEDGGSEYQCVQYCGRPSGVVTRVPVAPEPLAEGPAAPAPATTGVAPPVEPVTAAPVPPAPATGCELLIYSEANFQGVSSPAEDNQASLDEQGWKNAIASIQIKSGTWDFYSDEDFGGEMMRLGVGSYGALDPQWSKHIGSFMCSSPGN